MSWIWHDIRYQWEINFSWYLTEFTLLISPEQMLLEGKTKNVFYECSYIKMNKLVFSVMFWYVLLQLYVNWLQRNNVGENINILLTKAAWNPKHTCKVDFMRPLNVMNKRAFAML